MSRILYTLAFPELSKADQQWIDLVRLENDAETASMVEPHFTLVFGCKDIEETGYLSNVDRVAKVLSPIRFICRRAVVGTDCEGNATCVFLVPDDGYKDLLQLHDLLYAGLPGARSQFDVLYVPHITVGRCENGEQAMRLCDRLNETPISIAGAITAIAVIAIVDGIAGRVATYCLGKNTA